MGATTKIEWADRTFNPWLGCSKVSPACDNCYAEAMDKRFSGGEAIHWGANAPRRRTSADNWKQPLRWNRTAEAAGVRSRVFCASMADVFDNEVLSEWREDLFNLIDATPMLDWLLLTKRIGNVPDMLKVMGPRADRIMRERVWLGVSVVNQREAERDIPRLQAAPAALRFLSLEPLIAPVSLSPLYREQENPREGGGFRYADYPLEGKQSNGCGFGRVPKIDWVIAGGESGSGARPSNPQWFRELRDQCAEACTPFFFKQWGEWAAPSQTGIGEPWPKNDDGALVKMTWNEARLRDEIPIRITKKLAGATLDGVEHKAMP